MRQVKPQLFNKSLMSAHGNQYSMLLLGPTTSLKQTQSPNPAGDAKP
jgi:hypothetical protein